MRPASSVLRTDYGDQRAGCANPAASASAAPTVAVVNVRR
jgi:hypothetical protein